MASKATASLASAMASAFAEIEGAAKDKTNPHFKSKYADLGSVMDAIKPALVKHGLFFVQRPEPSEDGVIVATVLRHGESGEEMDLGKLYVPANKRDAQGFGSALTYARRYALMTAFGVPAEDDDGNAASRSAYAANDGTANGNGHSGPAPRTKLDGPHTSKTALRAAVFEVLRKVREAESLDALDKIKSDNRVTINQALRDWPELINGEPNIEEDIGLKGAIEMRRQQLGSQEGAVVSGLIDSMKQCQTSLALANWRAANEEVIDALDGAEGRKFELAFELHESAIQEMERVSS